MKSPGLYHLKIGLTQLKIGLTQAKIDQTPSENLLTQIFGQVLVCPCRKSAEKKTLHIPYTFVRVFLKARKILIWGFYSRLSNKRPLYYVTLHFLLRFDKSREPEHSCFVSIAGGAGGRRVIRLENIKNMDDEDFLKFRDRLFDFKMDKG